MLRGLLVLLLAFLMSTAPQVCADTNRGVGTVEMPAYVALQIGKQYLVVIAVDEYQHWMPLRSPVRCAKELKKILESRYSIDEVYELYDEQATKANIIKLFVDLQRKVKSDDSLLVLYSGHGHLDENSDTGFWIPVNAGTDVYEQRNWLPHTQLKGLIANLQATHVLLISDSCFAGDLIYSTRSLPTNITAEYFKGAYSRVSRQVLTSGAVEAVPDESPFTDQLISVLKRNTNPVIDTLMLYNEVRLGVRGSTPLIGFLAGTGHQEGASFLLFLRDDTAPADRIVAADGSKPEALPLPSEGTAVGLGVTGSNRPTHFSTGLAWGWNITFGEFKYAFRSGPSPSCRLHYHYRQEWGEIGMGLRVGALILTGKEDLENPFYPDTVDGTAWLVAASVGYTSVYDPLLFFTAEVAAGVAMNEFRRYTPDMHQTKETKPYLGSAVGVGLRLLDRLKVTVYGRFHSIYLDDGVFLGISPEISAEYAF